MACILVELFTGELFFDTHENLEHLAMIEKQCGPLPRWMAQTCSNKSLEKYLFYSGESEEEEAVAQRGHRVKWPESARKHDSVRHLREMLLIQDIIENSYGPEYR